MVVSALARRERYFYFIQSTTGSLAVFSPTARGFC